MAAVVGKRKRSVAAEVQTELEKANELLEADETTPKQIWQIGKQMKRLLGELESEQDENQLTANIYFVWGAALARLASQNEDATLAEAAVDKFQQCQSDVNDPIGLSLWASSLLILGLEKQDFSILVAALGKFQQASTDDPEFETQFQCAKASKEITDFYSAHRTQISSPENFSFTATLNKAIQICEELFSKHSGDQRDTVDDQSSEDDEEEVSPEDLSEVCLLHAQLLYSLAKEKSSADKLKPVLQKSYVMFNKAIELWEQNTFAVVELNTALLESLKDCPESPSYSHSFDDLSIKLQQIELKLRSSIKSTLAENEGIQEEDDNLEENNNYNTNIQKLANLYQSLSWNLYYQLFSPDQIKSDDHEKLKEEIVTFGESAHCLIPEFGCYVLASAYGSFADEEKCRKWLEICESYGVIMSGEEGGNFMNAIQFKAYKEADWFKDIINNVLQC